MRISFFAQLRHRHGGDPAVNDANPLGRASRKIDASSGDVWPSVINSDYY